MPKYTVSLQIDPLSVVINTDDYEPEFFGDYDPMSLESVTSMIYELLGDNNEYFMDTILENLMPTISKIALAK